MDKVKREVFETWLNGCNWFKINEVGTPNGQQDHYLTPAGEIMIAQYNLQGELQQIAKPMPPQPQATVMRKLDFRGGAQMPPGLPG
jgi:hypothetical protein